MVQLTWEANYAHATTELRKHGVIDDQTDLVQHPDLALQPNIAAAIMIYGCLEGWFTGKKLSDYFHDGVSDWIDARRIINGMDHAYEIASDGDIILESEACPALLSGRSNFTSSSGKATH